MKTAVIPPELVQVELPTRLRPVTANQARELSLEESLQRALRQNPRYLAAVERVHVAEADYRAESAANTPQLSVGATWVPDPSGNPDEAVSQFFDTDETNLRYTFPTSGRRTHRALAARARLGAARAQLASEKLDLELQVKQAYIDLQVVQQTTLVFQDAYKMGSTLVRSARKQVDLGLVPETNITRTEIDLAQSEQEILRIYSLGRVREEILASLLALPSGQHVVATDPLRAKEETAEDIATLRSFAEGHRPEITNHEARLRALESDVNVRRSDRRPDLTFQSSFTGHVTNSGNPPVKALISVPLWDRGAIGGLVERTRAEARVEQALLAGTQRQVGVDVTMAFHQMTAAIQRLYVLQETMSPRARSLLQRARAAYQNGLGTLLDVLDAQRVYRQTALDEIELRGEVARTKAALERAAGQNSPVTSEPESRRGS